MSMEMAEIEVLAYAGKDSDTRQSVVVSREVRFNGVEYLSEWMSIISNWEGGNERESVRKRESNNVAYKAIGSRFTAISPFSLSFTPRKKELLSVKFLPRLRCPVLSDQVAKGIEDSPRIPFMQ